MQINKYVTQADKLFVFIFCATSYDIVTEGWCGKIVDRCALLVLTECSFYGLFPCVLVVCQK